MPNMRTLRLLGKQIMVLCFLLPFGNLSAQDCSCEDCPFFVPDVGQDSTCINVSGLTNPILGVGGQGLCELAIDFQHTWIGELNIRLIAPDGSSVDLVYDLNPGNNSGEFWDVTYLPCSEPVMPDPTMPDIFSSQNWPGVGPFTGSYYPGNGCLEDLTGNANGLWCIEVIDNVFGDATNIFDWSLTFCDGSGSTCGPIPCDAVGGELTHNPLNYCEGDPSLLLTNIMVEFENQDIEYAYTFFVYEEGPPPGPIIEYSLAPDLSSYAVGDYTICGLNYLLADELLITPADGSNTINDLNSAISNGDFCGDVSSTCFTISIEAPVPSPILNAPTEVCVGDIITVVNTNYDPTLTYTVISSCGTCSDILITDENYITMPNDDTDINVCFTAQSACGDQTTCVDIIVNPNIIPDPEILGDINTCYGNTYVYNAVNLIGIESYMWYISNNQDSEIVGSNTDPSVTVDIPFNVNQSASICLEYTSDCGVLGDICLDITPPEDFSNPVNLTPISYCGLAGELIVSADGTVIGEWSVVTGPGSATFDPFDMMTTLATVTTPGLYTFEFIEPDCGGLIQFEVLFEGDPSFPEITGDSVACQGDMLSFVASNITGGSPINWYIFSGDGSIVGDNTSSLVDVLFGSTTTRLCVEYTDECNQAAIDCIDLLSISSNLENMSTLDTCGPIIDLIVTDNGIMVPGVWSQTSGPGTTTFTDENNSITQAEVSTIGDYTYAFSTSCSSVEFTVSIRQDLLLPQYSIDCEETGGYIVTINMTPNLGPYYVNGDTIIDTIFTSELLFNTRIMYIVSSEEGCSTYNIDEDINCSCVTRAGTITVDEVEACADQLISVVGNGDEILEPDDTLIFVLHTNPSNTLGTILDQNTDGEFSFLPSMTYGTTYYLSSVAGNSTGVTVDLLDTCLSVSIGTPIVFYENPVFSGLTIESTSPCDSSICITADSLGYEGTWDIISSPVPGSGILSNSTDFKTQVTKLTPGDYIIEYTIQNGPCSNDTTVVTSRLPSINIQNIRYECDPTLENYTPSFDIVGGVAPYTVNGVEQSSSSFVGLLTPNGTSFTYTISDQTLCDTLVFISDYDCEIPCTSDPGLMSIDTIFSCAEDQISIQAIGAVIGSTDDSLTYVIHTSPTSTIGTIIQYSAAGEFDFIPSMNYGQTYYLSAVVFKGDPIDYLDNCTILNEGTPVVWRMPSEVEFDVASSICIGSELPVSITYDGSLPATIFYEDAMGNSSNLTIVQLGSSQILVGNLSGTSIEFTRMIDGNGCMVLIDVNNQYFEFDIIEPPTITPQVEICNTQAEGSTITLSSLLTNQNVPGTWSSSAGVITGDVIDFDGVSPDDYVITFTPEADNVCNLTALNTMVIVEDCECPDLSFIGVSDLCQGPYSLDLNFYIDPSFVGLGSWSIITLSGDPLSVVNPSGVLVMPEVLGSYEVHYTFTNVPVGCTDDFFFNFKIEPLSSAGVPINDSIQFCEGELEELNLFDFIQDFDPGGLWSSNSILFIDENTGNVGLNGLTGEYDVSYAVQSEGVCPDDTTTVTINISELEDLILEFFDPECFGINDGSVDVQNANGDIIDDYSLTDDEGNVVNPDSLFGGNYQLSYVDQNGCIVTESFSLNDPLQLFLDLGNDIILDEGSSIIITPETNVEEDQISLLEWFINNDIIDNPFLDTLILSPNGETLVEIIITDTDGCIIGDDLLIQIKENIIEVLLPNIFNSGKDLFGVDAFGSIQEVKSLGVYDRWGNRVFLAENYDPADTTIGWDGSFNGQRAASGVYIYKLEYLDNNGATIVKYGDVTLIN